MILLFSARLVFSSKPENTSEPDYIDGEELMDMESLKQQEVEESTFQDMMDTQGHHEVIPKPKKKKTRGKHRKFWWHQNSLYQH